MSRTTTAYSSYGSTSSMRSGATSGGGSGADGDLPPMIAARTVNGHVPAGRWSWLPWRWSGRRQQTLDSYTRLATLLDTLQGHFDRQDQRAGELNNLLEKLAHTIEDAAQDQRAVSAQSNEKIAALSEHTAGISAALSELPTALQAQNSVLKALKQQAEVSQEVDVQVMHSLQRFGPTLETMRETSHAGVKALEKMLQQERDSRQDLTRFVQKQSQRLFAITLAAGILTLLAVAAAGVLVFRSLV